MSEGPQASALGFSESPHALKKNSEVSEEDAPRDPRMPASASMSIRKHSALTLPNTPDSPGPMAMHGKAAAARHGLCEMPACVRARSLHATSAA